LVGNKDRERKNDSSTVDDEPCATKHHRPQRTNIARHRQSIPQAANTAVPVAVPRAVATLKPQSQRFGSRSSSGSHSSSSSRDGSGSRSSSGSHSSSRAACGSGSRSSSGSRRSSAKKKKYGKLRTNLKRTKYKLREQYHKYVRRFKKASLIKQIVMFRLHIHSADFGSGFSFPACQRCF
jgi:hypothetical protein